MLFLDRGKTRARQDELRGLVNVVYRLVQRIGFVFLVRVRRLGEIAVKITAGNLKCIVLVRSNRAGVGDGPFLGIEIERLLKQREVSFHVFRIAWIVLYSARKRSLRPAPQRK